MIERALVDVYDTSNDYWWRYRHQFLYDLLEQRPNASSISHQNMPTWDEHCTFVDSKPYDGWWFITSEGDYDDTGAHFHGLCGAIYLTKPHEIGKWKGQYIGVNIFKSAQRHGHGSWAVKKLIETHPDKRLLMNVAPGNVAGHAFAYKFGFNPIQTTYG